MQQEFLTLDHIYHDGDCEPLLGLPFAPATTRDMLAEAIDALCDFMADLTVTWQHDGVPRAAVAEKMHRAADRLVEIAMLYPDASYELTDDDGAEPTEAADEDDEIAEPPPAIEADDEIDEEIPARPAAQLAEDRLGDLAVLVDATFERVIDPLLGCGQYAGAGRIYIALALARRLLDDAEDRTGEEYNFDFPTAAALAAAKLCLSVAPSPANPPVIDRAERGFGPWEPAG